MTTQGLADWIIFGSLLLGTVLVFPWLNSAYLHRRTGGEFPRFGERTAIVGAFLLALSLIHI